MQKSLSLENCMKSGEILEKKWVVIIMTIERILNDIP